MKEIFTLVPERIQFEEFWIEIRKRNRWLIKLRFAAFGLLFSLALLISVLKYFDVDLQVKTLPIFIIAFSILIYNYIFLKIWNITPKLSQKFNFHCLHLSLIQIIADLITLFLLCYFTGGVESPFATFYVFHTIIGSLVLPGAIVFLIMTCVIMLSIVVTILEINKVLPHHQIANLFAVPLYNNIDFLVVYFVIFSIVIYISIYLANSIASVLYERERNLSIAYKKLQEAEKAKSKYVMSLVHDLKTPVSASLTWTNLLLEGKVTPVPELMVTPLERIQSRLNSALELIDDVLKFSTIKITDVFDRVEEIDLIKLFDDLYKYFRILLLSKNIDYKVHSNQEKVKIKGDSRFIRLAFSNLISNAQKYTDSGGVIDIMINDKGEYVEVNIADNGIGIPQDEIPNIFNEFFRTSVSKQKNIEGTGLGMAMVKEILDKIRGKIEVRSPSRIGNEEHPGTEIIIQIPKN